MGPGMGRTPPIGSDYELVPDAVMADDAIPPNDREQNGLDDSGR